MAAARSADSMVDDGAPMGVTRERVAAGMFGTPLPWLAAVLVAYLLVPIGAFLVRLAQASSDQLTVPGIGAALVVSVVTASIATVVIGAAGIPLAYLVASAVVPDLLASPGGQIVNVTMNHATMTRAGFVPYGPSRAGAESLSRIMAADLAGTGVRVNLLLPGGATATGMIPDDLADTSGLLPPEIMAEPVRWLCSPAAAEIHDQRIVATEFQSPHGR